MQSFALRQLSLKHPFNYTANDNAHRQHIATSLSTLVYGRYAYSLIETVLGQRLGVLSTLWKNTFFIHEKDLLWFFAGLRKVRPNEVLDATPGIPLRFRGHYERIDKQEPFSYHRIWARMVALRVLLTRYRRYKRRYLVKKLHRRYYATRLPLRFGIWQKAQLRGKTLIPLLNKRKRLLLTMRLLRLARLGKHNGLKFRYGSVRFRHFFWSICLTRYVICRRLFFSSPTWASKRSRRVASQKYIGRSLSVQRRGEHSCREKFFTRKRLKHHKGYSPRHKIN